MLEIGTTSILPAAVRYQTELATNVAALKAAGVEADASALTEVSGLVTSLRAALGSLSGALAHEDDEDLLQHALHSRDSLLPAMLEVRAAADALECIVADDLWPLPTYQEMLFML